MLFSNRRFWTNCAALMLLVIFAVFCFFEWASLRDELQIRASFLVYDGERRDISLPFSENSPVSEAVFEYIVELEWRQGSVARFRVIPDDYLESITVNGQRMPEELYSGPGRRDWQNGLVVDFASYLSDGVNEILFVIADHGGKYGMNLTTEGIQDSPIRILTFSLISLSVLFLFWFSLFYVISRR